MILCKGNHIYMTYILGRTEILRILFLPELNIQNKVNLFRKENVYISYEYELNKSLKVEKNHLIEKNYFYVFCRSSLFTIFTN